MVVGIPVMRFNDIGSYFLVNQSRNRERGRGVEGVVLLRGVKGGEGYIGSISGSQLAWW